MEAPTKGGFPMNCCGQDHNEKNKRAKGGMAHLWMMALCCGAPLLIVLAVSALGANFPAVRAWLVSILPFACPVLMLLMIPLMLFRGRRGRRGGIPAEPDGKTDEKEK
jgi:hypothetical protein